MGLRWHIVQKKLPQSVKKRARWLWRAQKNLQGGALMCNSLRGLLSWQGGFYPEALPACKVGAGLPFGANFG